MKHKNMGKLSMNFKRFDIISAMKAFLCLLAFAATAQADLLLEGSLVRLSEPVSRPNRNGTAAPTSLGSFFIIDPQTPRPIVAPKSGWVNVKFIHGSKADVTGLVCAIYDQYPTYNQPGMLYKHTILSTNETNVSGEWGGQGIDVYLYAGTQYWLDIYNSNLPPDIEAKGYTLHLTGNAELGYAPDKLAISIQSPRKLTAKARKVKIRVASPTTGATGIYYTFKKDKRQKTRVAWFPAGSSSTVILRGVPKNIKSNKVTISPVSADGTVGPAVSVHRVVQKVKKK